MSNDYIQFCDTLLFDWSKKSIILEDGYGFDLSGLPEPYLKFGKKGSNVCFLTTNPGGVMNFQKREYEFSKAGELYSDLSVRLAKYYKDNLTGAAKTRILKMKELSTALVPESDGFVQFEISPFHSTNFPVNKKEKFSKNILNGENSIHADYTSLLTSSLKHKSCICIQAGYPKLERLDQNWLSLISKILSVKKEDWKLVEFKFSKGVATTGVFYYKEDNFFKAILFNSSGNNIPKIDSMTKLLENL